MPTLVGLWCIAGFLAVSVIAVALGRRRPANAIVYGATGRVALVALGAALARLLTNTGDGALTLPIGLPGLGAHLRLAALAAFFLLALHLAGAGPVARPGRGGLVPREPPPVYVPPGDRPGGPPGSLYAIGYGAHEPAP